ncbi:MarR family transcriptional regulator, transcriptional regulator for hemolysin [Selenomonas sp. GACV-9]|uniref:MarR family winged helix-turn-helix transcriptional regulator n=1 Tax=Selenomonas sp. GACV-9 TaxID=3158782 RepID=UPI0008E9B503|nr:MarR family transcriptional regulator, transcriptional regulator for hemolysin [Selenomonas ruminantium]
MRHIDTAKWQDELIHQLYQTMRAFGKTLNSSISPTGIYGSEWTILNLVRRHDGIAQADIINLLGVEPAAVSKTVSKLEQKGIVRREQQQGTRGKAVFLTEKARDLCAPLEQAVAAHRQQALAGLSQEECENLRQLMARIEQNVLHSNQ